MGGLFADDRSHSYAYSQVQTEKILTWFAARGYHFGDETSEPAPTRCVQAKKEGVGAMIGQPVRSSPAAQGGLPAVGNSRGFGCSRVRVFAR